VSSGDLTRFCDWLRSLGLDMETVYWYCAYTGRLPLSGLLLDVGRVGCNSWLLKLSRHYTDFLLDTGQIGVGEYARLRLELQARERVCRKRLRTGGRGAYRCPERSRLLDKRTRTCIMVLVLAEGGVGLRQLWRVARSVM